MTYNILIVGLKGQDAGKTTFALALLAYLREKGHNACAFKPRAGNNVWYDFDVVHDALSQGRLYGKDATRLKAASAFSVADDPLLEECINPIHRLWMEPPRINSMSQIPGFIIDRVTLRTKDGARNLVVENEALPAMYRCSDTLLAQLRAKASKIYHVRVLGPHLGVDEYLVHPRVAAVRHLVVPVPGDGQLAQRCLFRPERRLALQPSCRQAKHHEYVR